MHLLDETGTEVDCLTENVPYCTESITWIDETFHPLVPFVRNDGLPKANWIVRMAFT